MPKRFFPLGLGLLLLSVNACAQNLNCQTDNADLQAMPTLTIEITREDGSVYVQTGKLADNDKTRAAGFQRVCGSTIESSPILFDFKRQLMPRFHMNNVVAPIDIAFIDKNGRIESIQAMKPYILGSNKKPLYGPRRPIVAAFEVHPGFFEKHNLNLKSTVTWYEPSAEAVKEPSAKDIKEPSVESAELLKK